MTTLALHFFTWNKSLSTQKPRNLKPDPVPIVMWQSYTPVGSFLCEGALIPINSTQVIYLFSNRLSVNIVNVIFEL